jgi:DNA-directed RNA polymerase subunit RPC12/RpoP
MPIRFRCAYCNQLMGISRRKAGTVIRCPRCAGQVIVPKLPDGQTTSKPGPTQPAEHGAVNLFERNDFENLFDAPGPAPSPVSPSAMSTPVNPNGFELETLSASTPGRPGIFLTPPMLTLLSVVLIILLGLAFFLGILVGNS